MGRPDGELLAALRHIWNRKLYEWWGFYNREYLSGALCRPVIELSAAGSELGRWDGHLRRLVVSARHIECDPWLEVMDTLRHEMAHQYVEEILGAHHEKPHGPGFLRACQKLRCRHAARVSLKMGTEDDRVLRLLKKILTLVGSPNENEAQAAVKKARRLLLKYNIDIVALDGKRQFDSCCLGPVKGRRLSYELWLALILQDFFFIEAIWTESYDACTDKRGTVLQVYGTISNLDMAEYVYVYLTQLMQRLWFDYRRDRGLTGNRERQRYYVGVLEGFHGKLCDQEASLRVGGALVWVGDARLRSHLRWHHPSVHTTRGGGVRSSQAYRDGLVQGGRVSIQRPLMQPEGKGGYLPA